VLTLRVLAAVALTAPVLAIGSGPSAAVRLCQGEVVTIEAPASGATVLGTEGPDVIDGIGRHHLTIDGGGGDDVICTGPGGGITARGGPGADRIEGGQDEYDVVLDGGPGDDVLRIVGAGSVTGGEGNDRLIDANGPSYQRVTLVPGPGDDVVVGSGRRLSELQFGGTAGVRISVPDGVADGEGHDTFTGIGVFVGSTGSDTFLGSPRADWFLGDAAMRPGSAPDVAYGAGGRDSLTMRGWAHGGTGADSIRIYGDRSTAKGGAGDDRIVAPSGSRCLTRVNCQGNVDGGSGRDRVTFGASGGRGVRVDLSRRRARQGAYVTTVARVEDVVGTARADVLIGNTHDNTLRGGRGNDVLRGHRGADRLFGEGGRDRADGGTGADRCVAEMTSSCR
jgi:Ca2+-binding RTX toxin-like protein